MLGEYKNNKARIPEGIQKLKSEKNIYLYGNADYAKRMFDVLNRFQIEIKGVLVSREYWREEIFYNNVVYKAEEFFENTHESIVLVAGFDIRIHKELLDRLIAEKFVKTIYVLNGCEIFWNNWNYVPDSKVFLIDNYYGGVIERNLNYEYFMDNRKNFQQTYIWLEDEKSRKTMLDYLRGHIELTNFPMREVWKVADVENQYFPEDIIQLKEDEIFVDCGAYTGDTLEIFLEKSKGYKKYYALEPDKRRFQELNEKLRKNVIHVPVGAWYKKAQLSFSFESTCGEIVKEKRVELERIDADQIDNIIDNNEKVTFIKMDIEGAELSALYGAKETIERNKPTLAICVYHKREDLITIPQYIKKLVPEYKLYLRAHFPYASELVIYGIYE